MDNLKKPLVTVLIPAYNHEKYVEEAVMSVINQSYGYENIQLIVTDDNSKDSTASILSKLATDYNFKLIKHTVNTGISPSLNEMISNSEGEYITCFASDDILVLDRIENQVNFLIRNPDIDILAGESILIDESGKPICKQKNNQLDSFSSYSFEDIFLKQKSGFTSGTAIFKSSLFQRIGTYEPTYKVEDFYFFLKATYNNAKVVKCNLPFLNYRMHNESASSNNDLMDEEGAKILEIYKSHPKYSLALKNREFYMMSKWIFHKRSKVIQHLFANPKLLLNKKIIKILIMLMLPKLLLKRKFPENYYRYETR